jgi:hypothetical protein
MRRALGTVLLSSLILGGASIAAAEEGPPIGGCPPAGGWDLVSVDLPDAPIEADINDDGLLCRKAVDIPAFPGFGNFTDNVLKITAP